MLARVSRRMQLFPEAISRRTCPNEHTHTGNERLIATILPLHLRFTWVSRVNFYITTRPWVVLLPRAILSIAAIPEQRPFRSNDLVPNYLSSSVKALIPGLRRGSNSPRCHSLCMCKWYKDFIGPASLAAGRQALGGMGGLWTLGGSRWSGCKE